VCVCVCVYTAAHRRL